VSFRLDDVLVVESGGRAASYREEDGLQVMKQDEIMVRVALGRGAARIGLDMRFLARLRVDQPITGAEIGS
jgi:glutamate N-acetyltransferase/amino-acid N-acetyltransferase